MNGLLFNNSIYVYLPIDNRSIKEMMMMISGVAMLERAHVQGIHTGLVWAPRWARVHCTPCTLYCYATDDDDDDDDDDDVFFLEMHVKMTELRISSRDN